MASHQNKGYGPLASDAPSTEDREERPSGIRCHAHERRNTQWQLDVMEAQVRDPR